MKSTDKILLGIVIGIVALVAVAFAVTLLKPDPTYRGEATPEDVAYNYLLALQKEDYDRAFDYLSPTLKGYPQSADSLAITVYKNQYTFPLDQTVTLEIDSADILGDLAFVKVRETRYYGGGLFDSGQRENYFDMELKRVDGEWKVIDSDDYFVPCWNLIEGCD
jgi:hypothetical protein